jgi:hypothetical protein
VPRFLLILLFIAFWIVPGLVAAADTPGKNLIPVKPSYEEAVAGPSSDVGQDDMSPPPATPAEQLYVFWFLGKVLSYPVDMLEAYVTKVRTDWQAKPVPAAAPAGPNPFETRSLGQVPPAPPVLSSPARHP